MTTNEKQFAFTANVGFLLVYAHNKGYTVTQRDGYRDPRWQRILYEIGRTRELKRKPVTWTLKSLHCKALATDIIVFVDGQPVWDYKHPIWQDLGEFWESMGGEWGGRWLGDKRDVPHFQWAMKMMEV